MGRGCKCALQTKKFHQREIFTVPPHVHTEPVAGVEGLSLLLPLTLLPGALLGAHFPWD